MKKLIYCFLISTLILTSCSSRRNLVYFSNLANNASSNTVNEKNIKIQSNDILNVTINSLSAESNTLFTSSGLNNLNSAEKSSFKVTDNGMINLPILGNIMVKGLSIEQAQQTIYKAAERIVKNPFVQVQILNFKITVIGEVNHPASFTVPAESMNLLEALGMAGDMTVYGKRENVLIIREEAGKRIMARLDLNDQSVMNSPFFNLKQNDIIYIEPDKSKAIAYSQGTRTIPIVLSAVSIIAVVVTSLINNR